MTDNEQFPQQNQADATASQTPVGTSPPAFSSETAISEDSLQNPDAPASPAGHGVLPAQTLDSPESAEPGQKPFRTAPWRITGFLFEIVLMGAVAFFGLKWVIDHLLHTATGQRIDQRLMEAVLVNDQEQWRTILALISNVTMGVIGGFIIGLVVIALLRRRWSLAVGTVVMIVGANVTTQFLKGHLTTSPQNLEYPNSMPSGHSTVGMTLAMAAIMVAPPILRWLVLPLAGAFATFMGIATVIGQWHRPGDVIAAFFVTSGWAVVAFVIIAIFGGLHPTRYLLSLRSILTFFGGIAVVIVMFLMGLHTHPFPGATADLLTAVAGPMFLGCILLTWVGMVTDRYIR